MMTGDKVRAIGVIRQSTQTNVYPRHYGRAWVGVTTFDLDLSTCQPVNLSITVINYVGHG